MDKLIGIREVAELFGLGRTAAYELTHRPDFPRPVVISPRCYRWPAAEVAAFAEALRRDVGQCRESRKPRRGRGSVSEREAATRRIIGSVRPVRGRRRAEG